MGETKVQDGRKNKRIGRAYVGRDVVEQGSGQAGQVEALECQNKMQRL